MLLLLVSGDVESNPGPDRELLAKIELVLKNQTDIRAQLNSVDSAVKKLEDSVSQLQIIDTKVTAMQKTIDQLSATVQAQQVKLNDLEDRSRRNNIVIYCIEEQEGEDIATLKDVVVNKLFSERMQVVVKSVERIHRIGLKKVGKVRPIIARLYDYNEKVAIFKNAMKLKNSKISISDDYSNETRRRRKRLWDSTKDERSNGRRVKLVRDRLKLNDEWYTWDDASNKRVKTGRPHDEK